MKSIMAKEASQIDEGVSNFEYNPVYHSIPEERLLFKLSRPINDLGDLLFKEFSGKTITMLDIYQQHNADAPYIKKNHKDTLSKLEEKGKIIVERPRKNTFGDTVRVIFFR